MLYPPPALICRLSLASADFLASRLAGSLPAGFLTGETLARGGQVRGREKPAPQHCLLSPPAPPPTMQAVGPASCTPEGRTPGAALASS